MSNDAMDSARSEPKADFAVVGLGATGRSVLRYAARSGASCIGFDTRPEPPALAELEREFPALRHVSGALDPRRLGACGQVIVSPGVALTEPALVALRAAGRELIGDIELFARAARAPIVAITGTNGKSTVTTLVADMLEAGGARVQRGGNLGTPALDLLAQNQPDFYVLELSSFQLELTASLAPRVACILNLAPDHLDRHGSFESYAQAKARVLQRAEVAVLNGDDVHVRELAVPATRIDFSLQAPGPQRYGLRRDGDRVMLAGADHDVIEHGELGLVGAHNLANALAAIAIAEACGIEPAAVAATLRTFRGLPHRAQRIATIDGIDFIDDSKATNPGAACASIAGVLGATGGVLIAGGQPKGAAFDAFADAAVSHAHTLVLIGEAAGAIAATIDGRRPCVFADGMPAAVEAAFAAARRGESVLLAPACASFDQFANYEARGRAFRDAVMALEGRNG